VSVTAAFGSLTYGYAAAILGNVSFPLSLRINKGTDWLVLQTLEKAAFYEYMNLELEGPGAANTTSIIAWWNTILYVGGFFACMSYTAFGNRYGRKSGIALGATVSVIGAVLQAGSINPAMMIVARLIVGGGMGVLLPAVPLYQAETAPPSNRGLLVGIHGEL
jgi:MFS family permease